MASSAIKTTGMARDVINAAAAPKSRTIHEKTATKMAKLTADGLPAKASAMTLPIKAVMSRVIKN